MTNKKILATGGVAAGPSAASKAKRIDPDAGVKIIQDEKVATSNTDGKLRYDIFVKAYNETREHGGINGLTPSEMFLQRLITSTIRTRAKQQSVTHVGN